MAHVVAAFLRLHQRLARLQLSPVWKLQTKSQHFFPMGEIFWRECFNDLVSICEILIASVEFCRLTGGLRGSFDDFATQPER